jgi:hypothetical protein
MIKIERKLWPVLLIVGILALYLLLPTKNYFWDGVDFAQHIEDATRLDASLIHPNHLFYNAFGYLVYRAAHAFGMSLRAIEVLQITNSVLSVIAAYVFFRIIRRTLGSTYLNYTLTLLFSLSATWWKFSTDADSYIPSVLFIILSFYFVLPDRKPRPLLVAILHSASMMFHQMAVFFFPVLVVGIYLQTRELAQRRRVRQVIEYSAAAFIITFSTFYLSFYLQTGSSSFQRFLQWTTSLSPEPGHTFSIWGNFVYTLNGHVKLFTSGRVLYLKNSLGLTTIPLLALLLILVVALFWKLARNFAELKLFLATFFQKDDRFKLLRILCAVWIVTFLTFQYFFVPQHTFYRLFYLPAILLLIGTYLAQFNSSQPHKHRFRVALLVAIIALSNLTFYILPLSKVENFPPLEIALKLHGAWRQGAVIYFASRNSDNSLVRYFNPSAVWIETDREKMEGELKTLQGRADNAWLETSLIDLYQATPEGRKWLEAHTIERPELELVNDKYRLQYFQLKPEISFNDNSAK